MPAWESMWEAFVGIVKSPFADLSVMWLLAPILLLWFILEVYFDSHKKEQLGWNTSLGNAISMFWIGVTLMKYLFQNGMEHFSWYKLIVVTFMVLYSVFIGIISFEHSLSQKLTFLLASPSPVYYVSSIAIIWTYGSLQPNWWTFLDLVIIFPLIIGIERLIRLVIPESSKDEESEDELGGDGFDKGMDKGFDMDKGTAGGTAMGSSSGENFDNEFKDLKL